MITVHPAQTLSYLTRAEPSLPVTPLDSVTSHVIALFQSRLTDAQAGPAPTHLKGPGAQTQQRIEHLLRFAIAPEQPSLAEQISKLIENTPSPLTDQSLSNKVAALLNQPSALDSQKTYKELIRQLLEDSPTSAPNIRAVRPRVPRHALDAHSATAPHTSPVRQFADALVDRGDRQLAMNIANSLVRQRLAFESGDDADVDGKAAIPPDSTFGQALGELGDALNSEPFKSFAETHLIDISNAAFTTSGDLYDFKDGKIKQYSLARDSEWAAASAAVLAALKKVCKGHFVGIHGYDRNYAPAAQVAWFYGMEQGNIRGSETLSNINQLMRNGTFNALSNTDPLYAKHYAPIKQRQRDASQRIADLPLPQLKQRLAEFAPPSVSQNVQEADRAIAEQCNRGLLKLLLNPQDSDYESPVMLKEIPEYSTFNQARKNLLTALTGSVFTTFAQDNQIDPTSISIHPITGELNGKKKGIETTISLNDISGWSDVWEEVRDAVQQMAAGSDTPVQYPNPSSAKLNDILNFYHEPVPRQLDASQTNWQRLNLVSVLERSAALANNHGFNALINSDADDTRSTAVRESQQTIIRQLAGTSVPLSPLETLAAAVAPRVDTQVEPEDASASAESALAVAVHRVMLELNTNPTGATSKMIEPIPANSLFGQWWAQLGNALKGRGLAEWARQESVELASLRFDPVEKALFGKVNGFDQRFPLFAFANTYPEYLDALTAVTNAAQALAANGKPLTLSLSLDNRAPYEYVSSFYGIDNSNFASPAFAASTALIGRTQNFPEHVQNPAKSLEQLHRQKTALGDSNDRHALINQLKHASIENDNTTRFVVDPNSSYQPKGVTTVKSFLAGQGLYGVSQPAETENLLKALQTPMPQSPPLGNSWGFLSTPAPLSQEQRDQVNQLVAAHTASSGSLLDHLSAAVQNLSTHPVTRLEQLLSSPRAQALGMELQTQLKGFPTPISVKQWLFTALVLNLDPQAGNQRNALAGFDFMDRENVGKTAQAISESFTQHLVQRHKVSSANAGIAAHLLLAGKAPQFLLKGLPDTLVYGTPEWVSLHTAVNRIEQLAPGAAAGMTYGQVMALHQIKPLSKAEEKQLLRAQMNPLIDWGVINHVIPKNAGDAYSLEQLQLCNTRLAEQTTQVAQARAYLSDVPVPTRRSLALENLKEKFGEQLPYEQRNLWRRDGEGLGYLASSVEAYEAGQLGDAYKPQNLIERFQASSSAWEAKDARIPIDAMYKKAASLPDVNAQYEAAIEKDFAGRRTHSIVQIKDLLSRIPELASNHLTYGRLEYYSVREPDTSVWQHLQAKTGKKGSHGIIIRSTDSSGNVSDYGVFPDARTVRKLEGLPVPMPIGGTNHSFGKIYDGRPEGAHSLPLDFNAFSSSASPQAGVTSEVIVERITPQTLINGELVNESTVTFGANRETQAPGYFNEAFEQIATTLVDSHFLRKDEFKAINRGHNPLETQPSTSLDRLNFLARMIPGVTSIEDIYQGNYVEAGRDLFFDALGILLPVGVGKLWSVAADAFEGAAVKTTEGLAVAAKDMSADAVAGENRVLSRLQNGDRLPGSAELQTRSDIANGRFNLAGDIKEPVKATAVFNDGKWYAYDTKTMAPYGPALEDFVSDTSSSVEQETFSDGAKALVTEKPLAADAYTVTRTHGFDLINEGKVYRYDTREPGLLRDLESADHYKPLEGFEAFCPAPGIGERVKRGANDTCFTKVVEEVSGELRQELQALEHVRLFPSTPKLLRKDQFVIFERRRWKMVDGEMGPQLHPVPESKPIAYKPKITGTLKNEPEFGFFNAQSSEALERETRVVKLNRISDAVDDKREVRGVIVNGTVGGSTAKYLVIEADTAEFYYARLDGAPGSELTFHKCTPDELSMVTAYRNKFSIRQGVANVPFDADFIALPKLNTAFEDLERSGYLKADIDELKASCKDLTKEQQREVVYRLQRAKAIDKADIALRPNQVSELAKPAEFATWTTEQQNKFYAEQAKDSVNRSMKATGLGPGNQIRSKADLARAEAAGMAIGWLRRTVPHGALNRSDLILKSGAGNCGEMALLSKDIIKKSGGRAYEWAAGDAHAFTVVGGPPVLPPGTPDFSEAAWADAWIVDPWANIACPAREYTQQLKKVMAQWERDNLKIMEGGRPISPLEKNWMTALIVQPKTPLAHGYIGA